METTRLEERIDALFSAIGGLRGELFQELGEIKGKLDNELKAQHDKLADHEKEIGNIRGTIQRWAGAAAAFSAIIALAGWAANHFF